MWQALAAHGVQRFQTEAEVLVRRRELDGALSELCLAISRETGDLSAPGLQRALALRAKPAAGGKSHYECINQFIHYWYCCAAAGHLLGLGWVDLVMRPTGHDNTAEGADAFDVEATHPALGRITGEVFCVSPALWAQKMAKTRAKLARSNAPIRAAFYNLEAKESYRPKMERLKIFGVEMRSGVVRELNG